MDDTSLTALIDGTWPAASYRSVGPFTLREGAGGGNRVSAATADGPVSDAEIDAAEAAMRDMGQSPVFMIRSGDTALDAQLAARGHETFDPVQVYTCPVTQLTDIPLPRVTVFSIWEPLAMMRDIWAQGGIGPARLAIMDRAPGPKTGLLARFNDKPGGTAYVAIHDGIAVLHALEILPHQRKQGLAKWMMRGGAFWAAEQGAHTMAVLCTRANTGANALYRSLGMGIVAAYHYRRPIKET